MADTEGLQGAPPITKSDYETTTRYGNSRSNEAGVKVIPHALKVLACQLQKNHRVHP